MSPPQLTLHAVPPSHPCMTADAALRLKGLEFERVDFQPGPHIKEMAAIYGEGQTTVPGMLVGDEPVHGSRAILDDVAGHIVKIPFVVLEILPL